MLSTDIQLLFLWVLRIYTYLNTNCPSYTIHCCLPAPLVVPMHGHHAQLCCFTSLLSPLKSSLWHICFFSLLPPECKRSRRNGLLIICQLELLNKGRPMCTSERQQRTWWIWGVKKLCGAQTAPNRCYADKIYIFWAVTPLFSANHQAGDTVLHLLPPQNAEFLDLEGFGCLNGFAD